MGKQAIAKQIQILPKITIAQIPYNSLTFLEWLSRYDVVVFSPNKKQKFYIERLALAGMVRYVAMDEQMYLVERLFNDYRVMKITSKYVKVFYW